MAFLAPVSVTASLAERASAHVSSTVCRQLPVYAGLRRVNKVDGVKFGVRSASSKNGVVFVRGGVSQRSSTPQIYAQAAPAVAPAPPAASIPSSSDPVTLTRWLLEEQRAGRIESDMVVLFSSIQTACKTIASQVNRAGIANLTGLAGSENIQGEDQKKLDVIANDVFKNALRFTGRMGIIASEEEDEPVLVDEDYAGNYVAVFDPLDGSSNIDAAVSTGSIFGIYKQKHACILDDGAVTSLDNREATCLVDVLQPGSNLIASGYCMYSSSTMMVLTLGNGVDGFTLDPMIGEFVLTHPKISCPTKGTIYSFNEGNYIMWDEALKAYINSIKNPPSGKPYSLRYIGSLVADIHRTLLYGGIFGYPADKKNPNGKLRLLYECAPMSYIVEQAGGKSSTGKQRVMDVAPEKVHQRLPIFLGSTEDVTELESYYAKY
eukprot:CAMPEP_0184650388 /NCGR_PEP_ID=MMETSP0308-20130426/7909_1 /TAXON_ID=38269 /ORGANISM="Gloeochaete witrockiana, Strain SAG 46.84" /LENGTH=433 /DNA_ID=CAMNT_0027083861 /DNA_START=72 /DNA_END=1373 /DNA_ORIENTATION=-